MAFNWAKVLGIKQNGSKNIADVVTFSALLNAFIPAAATDAASLTAYARGVQAISEAVAQVTFEIYETKDGVTSRKEGDNINYLLNVAPNNYQNSFDFWRSAIEMVLYRGNCFIRIERNETSGRPEALHIVKIDVRPSAAMAEIDGSQELFWMFNNDTKDAIPDRDVIHIKFNGYDDTLLGTDPLSQFSRSIGLSTSTENYADGVYKKNGNMSVVLTTDKALNAEQKANLRESWNNRYSGTNGEATVLLEEGMDLKPVSITPDQAKFIENRKFQLQEVARILGVPTPILMDYSDYNYNTAETADLDFYKRSISPKVGYIERELSKKLVSSAKAKKGTKIKGDVRPLFRADMETRMKYLQDRFSVGSISPNEVRIAEGDEPMENQPAMDKTYIMSNLAPSDKIETFYSKPVGTEGNNDDDEPIQTEED